jgi:hypothetical protein
MATQYLITNIRTLAQTWTDADTISAALISHENARRSAAGEAPLSPGSRIGREDTGASVCIAWIGDSTIRGRRENVTREVA